MHQTRAITRASHCTTSPRCEILRTASCHRAWVYVNVRKWSCCAVAGRNIRVCVPLRDWHCDCLTGSSEQSQSRRLVEPECRSRLTLVAHTHDVSTAALRRRYQRQYRAAQHSWWTWDRLQDTHTRAGWSTNTDAMMSPHNVILGYIVKTELWNAIIPFPPLPLSLPAFGR